jgi:hypothetical protein
VIAFGHESGISNAGEPEFSGRYVREKAERAGAINASRPGAVPLLSSADSNTQIGRCQAPLHERWGQGREPDCERTRESVVDGISTTGGSGRELMSRQERAAGTPLMTLGRALVEHSLCRRSEKRTMREIEG